MKNQPSRAKRGAHQVPLDHLRPGGRRQGEPGDSPAPDDLRRGESGRSAEPAEPATPGGESDAVRGKATRSPAAVATRDHLEGSEQSPG